MPPKAPGIETKGKTPQSAQRPVLPLQIKKTSQAEELVLNVTLHWPHLFTSPAPLKWTPLPQASITQGPGSTESPASPLGTFGKHFSALVWAFSHLSFSIYLHVNLQGGVMTQFYKWRPDRLGEDVIQRSQGYEVVEARFESKSSDSKSSTLADRFLN